MSTRVMAPPVDGTARVVIVDDHPIMRGGVAAVLGDDDRFVLVGEHGSAESALAALDWERPDVVVLDYELPGMTGLEACQAIRDRGAPCRVVMLTGAPTDGILLGALAGGASAFLAKGVHPLVVREAVACVLAGGTYIDPALAGRVVQAALAGRRASGPFGLSVQQRRVAGELSGGRSNAEIGRRLGVSGDTVKTHLSEVLRKLGAENRGEAAKVARLWGLSG